MTHIGNLECSRRSLRRLIAHGGKIAPRKSDAGFRVSVEETLQTFNRILIGSCHGPVIVVKRVESLPFGQGPEVGERNGGMVFRMSKEAKIENPREYASETVEDLRHLLLVGGQAERDPRREHFYNLEGDNCAYYIHISPITGNVILLAKWFRQPSSFFNVSQHLVA
jgi:hypothetical protein